MKFTARLRAAAKAAVSVFKAQTLSGVDNSRGWFSLFSSGLWSDQRWQTDTPLTQDNILAYVPVYSCATLITSDIGKLTLQLMTQDRASGIWTETTSTAFSPVLRKPNHYQTRQQFIETWVMSKVIHGNAYILKVRDDRQVVTALYVLDPTRVTPLVAPDGSVFYQLQHDDISKLPVDMPAIPAREIIHDRMECLFHTLVGVSPIFAAYLPASQGLRIQKNSEAFFKNMSRPSGMLLVPGDISDENAADLKKNWEENYSAAKLGKLAVLSNGMKYEPAAVNAVDAQLVEQLKLSAEQICSAFKVPAYMIGAGQTPSYNNVEALNQQYYSQCLQKLIEAIEALLDEGLGLTAAGYRTEFLLDDLLRMDTTARVKSIAELIKVGVMSPNEGRAKFGMKPVTGGETPYLQQQNWTLGQLAERTPPTDAPALPAPEVDEEKPSSAEEEAKAWRAIAEMPEAAREIAKAFPLGRNVKWGTT